MEKKMTNWVWFWRFWTNKYKNLIDFFLKIWCVSWTHDARDDCGLHYFCDGSARKNLPRLKKSNQIWTFRKKNRFGSKFCWKIITNRISCCTRKICSTTGWTVRRPVLKPGRPESNSATRRLAERPRCWLLTGRLAGAPIVAAIKFGEFALK